MRKLKEKSKLQNSVKDVLKTLGILSAATAIGVFFRWRGLNEANIITVYILGVLITAVLTSQRIFSLVSSFISVLLFNFWFTEPRFTFKAYDPSYLTTFPIMLAAAFITSSLAERIKKQAAQSAKTAYRTQILFDTNQQLSNEQDVQGIISVTCGQLKKLLKRDIIFYKTIENTLDEPLFFPFQEGKPETEYMTEAEKSVAKWAFDNNKHAGAGTKTYPNAKCQYLSVRVGQNVFGVLGIVMGEWPLDSFENSIVLSILGECALAMQNEKVTRERAAAALMAKNEQLRANLLRSISHDLRTPLTSISGNAGILISNADNMGKEKQQQLYEDIYEDSLWLINLVENLLSVTRIEDGTMKLQFNAELLEEIVQEAVHHVEKRCKKHKLRVKLSDDLILVKADARLIVQVLVNLVDNAVKYTPNGSEILIETKQEGKNAVVSVSDNGKGISDEAKEHIFEMFYTDSSHVADSRRSLGLGLALCKSILHVHGGNIFVEDCQPHGERFTFTLPAKEVQLHE